MKKILAITLVLAILFSFAACGGKKDVLSGKWEGSSADTPATWTFDDGKCKLSLDYGSDFIMDNEGTYKIDEKAGTVTIEMKLWDEAKVYEYKLDGSKLTLTATDEFSPSYDLTKK